MALCGIVLAMSGGCEIPLQGFSGSWAVHLDEVAHAYWVKTIGPMDGTLELSQTENTVTGSMTGFEEYSLAGEASGNSCRLTGRNGDAALILDMELAGSLLTGTARLEIRDGFAGWWNWNLEGQRM